MADGRNVGGRRVIPSANGGGPGLDLGTLLSPDALKLLVDIKAIRPGFRVCGVSTGDLRRFSVRPLSGLEFGLGITPTARAREAGSRFYGDGELVLIRHKIVTKGAERVLKQRGVAIAVPLPYSDCTESQKVAWQRDMAFYLSTVDALKRHAPDLLLPMVGETGGGMRQGFAVKLRGLEIAAKVEKALRLKPLCHERRDRWAAERRAQSSANQASAAAG